MAKGNDGNYLQHCIEVEAALCLVKDAPGGRLHVALTHGMEPFEELDSNGNAQKDLLFNALDEAAGEPQPDERKIVKAYRNSKASRQLYPNTGELLRKIVGTDKLQSGITETDSNKCINLTEAWSESDVIVKNSSWRKQLESGGILYCPDDLDAPWLFSMDPISYKQEVDEDDDEYLRYSDLNRLESALCKYFDCGQPGIASFFVYNMGSDGNNTQSQYWEFIDKLAKRLNAHPFFFWIPHNEQKGKLNLAGLLCTDERLGERLGACGIKTGRPHVQNTNNSRMKLKLLPKMQLNRTQSGPDMNTSNNDSTNESVQRRIERMENWIMHANLSDNNHNRFLFYWIAYEAAYKEDQSEKIYEYEHELRCRFHKRIIECKYASKKLQEALRTVKREATKLLKLRQASRYFWYKEEGWESSQVWEKKFGQKFANDCHNLGKAAHDGRELVPVLNALFENLYIVRHQIVHGGSSGKDSRGLNQVIWGSKILESVVPRFYTCIEENKSRDWGKPPFPRVGEHKDDRCLPPWMSSSQ